MKRLLMALVVLTGLIGAGGAVWAQDLNKGMEAYKSGDYVTALKEWRPLADQGNADAQRSLGYLYYFGEGVTKDYAEALKWYRKAAEQGDTRAQFGLGFLYYYGKGVTQDKTEAVKWFRKSAEGGYAAAQQRLVRLYADGDVVTKDYAEAVKWYRKAAEQGNAEAQQLLGRVYEDGAKGVLQDLITAHMWYNIAVANGQRDSAKYRDRAADKLTPSELVEARERAKRCRASGYKDCD